MADLPGHAEHRGREVDVAFLAVKMRGQPAPRFHAFELLEEVDVEVGAPELAVGDALQPDVFLQPHNVRDGAVLDGAQFRLVDLALLEPFARSEQLGRPKEASDVVGAKWWLGAQAHRVLTRRDP